MKNRKTVVVAFLLIATMLLGVGYAALTDVLDINGTAEVSKGEAEAAFNDDIYFTNAVAANAADGDTAEVSTSDPDMATFNAASLSKVGDKAVFTFTIINKGDSQLNAIIDPEFAEGAAGNDNTEYFKVTSNWNGEPQILLQGETAEYEVTVELLKTPEESAYGSFHIKLNATSTTLTTLA